MHIEDIFTANLPGVSDGTRAYLSEGAAVCLERQKHTTGVNMAIQGDSKTSETVTWSIPYTDQLDRSWKDQEVATEHGACCISILWAFKATPYTVIQRSRKKKWSGLLVRAKGRYVISKCSKIGSIRYF